MRNASVQQGLVFYSDFLKRIDDLHTGIKDYILSRDLEKNDLINAIQSGTNYQNAFNGNCKFLFIYNKSFTLILSLIYVYFE